MAHKTKQAALEAARKVLGNEAIEGVDFVIKNTGAGYEHAEVPPANAAAGTAQEARGVKAPAAKPKASRGFTGKRTPVKKVAAPAAPKKAPAAKKAPTPKADGPNKTEQLIAMMKRPGGATSAEMEAAAGWQPHSVRGLLGTLRKKKVPIVSTKNGKEPTTYAIKASAPAAAAGDVV